MKKTIILTGLLLLISLIADLFVTTSTNGSMLNKSYSATMITKTNSNELFDSKLLKETSHKNKVSTIENVTMNVLYNNIKGTVYHAIKSQTDNTPYLTADNSFIDTAKVNDLRWVALSRDLLNRTFKDLHGNKHVWEGKIKLGDTIWVDYDKKALWKMTHPKYNPKDTIATKKGDLKYEKLKAKYDQIKGYWIVHDVMGKQYTKRNRKGQYVLDENGNKQVVKIHNAIDFLQHPEYGMLDVWERNIIIAKRKVEIITVPLIASNL